MKHLLSAFALFLVTSQPATAAYPDCRSETFEGTRYTVCSFDPAKTDLRVFWGDAQGKPYGSFAKLARDLATDGLRLDFAMNAGMYQHDLRPVGLLVQDEREVSPANTKSAPAGMNPVPNFYKKPNGVFFLKHGKAGVLTTEAWLKQAPAADFATQSGPMLLIDGEIHPAFIVGSSDRKRRNGVGVSSPTEVHFVISEDRVNFHDFARFFRDRLGSDNALFLDGGSASGLYAPSLKRNDLPPWEGYGPIVGAVSR